MWDRAFPPTRYAGAARRAKPPRVEIKAGVRGELLVLIDGQLASLTRSETVRILKAAGLPVVRALCHALEAGTPEAQVEAAWLLGQLGSAAAISTLLGVIEGARWRGEAPAVLRRATEALLRLGPAGIRAFDRAVHRFHREDLIRLVLIRHGAKQLLDAVPPPPLLRQTTRAWARALAVYLARLERLDRASQADKLSFQRVVLEAYGLALEGELETVPALIDALHRYPAQVMDRARRAG